MRIRVCRHILDNGKFCQAVPLRGHIHCYHHQAMKRRMKMAQARVRMTLRLAKEGQSGIRIPFAKRGSKSVPALPVSLMESHG
jgi:hypothetical protein